MRALAGGIPRAFRSHKTPEGHAYRLYVTAVLRRLGNLPADARPTLREAGRAAVELERLGHDLDAARSRNRRRDAARVRKQQFMLREQLGRLERRLEEFSTRRNGHNDPLADVKRAVEAANRR